MDILYQNLLARLDTNVPDLRWIDLDQGQLETMEKSYPVQFPCCLIDFTNIAWQNVGRQLQAGDVTIMFRIAFDIYDDSNNLTPEASRNAGLLKLRLLNTIHHWLQGFGGAHYNRLNRIATTSEKRADGLKVYDLIYLTNMRDANGMETRGTASGVDLTINVERT